MDDSTGFNRFLDVSPYWLIVFWPFIHLVSFLPSIPQPTLTLGYLWKSELALAVLLLLTLISSMIFRRGHDQVRKIPDIEVVWIVVPLLAFAAWSGFSVIWAHSIHNAVHHTLLWLCFAIFYLLARQIIAVPKLEQASLYICALVLGIIGLSAVVSYAGSVKPITNAFTFRYYRYAEAFVGFVPLFLAMSMTGEKRRSLFFAVVALVCFLAVGLTLSRAIFVAGFSGIAVFFVVTLLSKKLNQYRRKALILGGLLIIVTGVSQVSGILYQKSTLTRLAGMDEHSQSTVNARYLYWGTAIELLKQSPLIGVGADNYSTNYRSALEKYAALDTENKKLELTEEVIPERAHNEFLQILSELGVVGFALFSWFVIGILVIACRSWRKQGWPLMTIALISGMLAFLISSLASAYSFRVTANGLGFFFLVAIFLQRSVGETALASEPAGFALRSRIKPFITVLALIVCLAMIGFSIMRAAGLMYLAKAQNTADPDKVIRNFQKAMFWDSRDPTTNYYFGSHLYGRGRTNESIDYLRLAIDRGSVTAPVYFQLATAQLDSGHKKEALETFREGLRVFPRSIFLRTAYSAYLIDNEQESLARIQLEKALAIDKEQAESWFFAHTKGIDHLSVAAVRDANLLEATKLVPVSGAIALVNYQNLSHKTGE